MAGVFSDQVDVGKLDFEPFKVNHSLMGNKALELESLTETLLELPNNQVRYSNSLLNTSDNFEETFRKDVKACSLEATLRDMLRSDSLIMVNSPETAPSFKPVYEEIMDSIGRLVSAKDPKKRVLMPTLYLFIASPNSVTPFHIDRYSTFLFQFRGSKEVSVAKPWDARVVSDQDCEAYVSYANTRLPWCDERRKLFETFEFKPGEALHIPFVSGHFVKNGSEDISISMSIIFNTEQTMMWRRALNFNHRARKILRPLKMAPMPVGRNEVRDFGKALLWQSWTLARGTA